MEEIRAEPAVAVSNQYNNVLSCRGIEQSLRILSSDRPISEDEISACFEEQNKRIRYHARRLQDTMSLSPEEFKKWKEGSFVLIRSDKGIISVMFHLMIFYLSRFLSQFKNHFQVLRRLDDARKMPYSIKESTR